MILFSENLAFPEWSKADLNYNFEQYLEDIPIQANFFAKCFPGIACL